nr:hypothetical protein [Vibrio cholerae]
MGWQPVPSLQIISQSIWHQENHLNRDFLLPNEYGTAK